MAAKSPDESLPRVFFVEAPFGLLKAMTASDALVSLDVAAPSSAKAIPKDPFAREVRAQLQAYFRNPAHRFDLPLRLEGTAFQNRVWRVLRRIPAGRTRSYGELADSLTSGPRAIGGACRRNPVMIVVPCHRVVAQTGLGGFMGAVQGRALETKAWLLAHERKAKLRH